MGILRFVFALSVAMGHMFGNPFGVTNGLAVALFFIISGFYMQLILTDGSYENKSDFYFSRFWRIYPVYYISLTLTVLIIYLVGNHDYIERLSNLNLEQSVLVVFANLLLFGADFSRLVPLDESLGGGGDLGAYALIIPPAWTLGAELLFYMVAPYFAKLNNKVFLRFLLFFFVLMYYKIWRSMGFDWEFRYHFILHNMRYFLIGMLLYRYIHIFEKWYDVLCIHTFKFRDYEIKYYILLLHAVVCGIFLYVPDTFNKIDFRLSIVCFVFIIPIYFIIFKGNKWDNYIGQYSYPIYIVHQGVVYLYNGILPSHEIVRNIFYISTVVVISIALVKIDDRITKYRHKVYKNRG